jgi:hypothetical protein
VEGSAVRRSVTEVGDGHASVTVVLVCKRDSGHGRDVAADERRCREHVRRPVTDVQRSGDTAEQAVAATENLGHHA